MVDEKVQNCGFKLLRDDIIGINNELIIEMGK